jgi:hypothetical protein
MSTISAFIDMLEQFINELIETFPDEKSFKKYQLTVQIARKANPRSVLTTFMESVTPYSQKLMEKDEAFMTEDSVNIEVINDLNIKAIWTPDLSENTKSAIWQYLQTLYLLGTTISFLPQDTLAMLEAVAKQCVDQIGEEGIQNSLGGLANLLGKNPPNV